MKFQSIYIKILLPLFILAINIQAYSHTFQWKSPMSYNSQIIRGQLFNSELYGTYFRLPHDVRNSVSADIWNISRNSSGLSIAFYSNSPEIKVRYGVNGNFSMDHMPSTGVSGIDLYAYDANGNSLWCGYSFTFADTITYTFSNLSYTTPRGYEYHLYLPLYNTVSWLEIGVTTDSTLEFIPASSEKPIVVYGTSIVQGACASRPGMAWTNIVERTLQHPILNFGFSGCGRLDDYFFNILAGIDSRLYIIDCMPNMTDPYYLQQIYTRTITGVKKLRRTKQTPILLVEHAGYVNSYTSQQAEQTYRAANIELKKAFNDLCNDGIENIYYMTKEEINLTLDSSVEGVHPNDLGMTQYANAYIRKISSILYGVSDYKNKIKPCKQNRDYFYDWNKRHEQILSIVKKIRPEIVIIGNSIIHYWGGLPECDLRRGEESWNELFSKKRVCNLGFGFDKIENILWRIQHGELDGYNARTIILLAGTNNLASDTDQDIINGIKVLVQTIKTIQPHSRLFVAGILPRTDMPKRTSYLNTLIQHSIDGNGATFIDVGSVLLNDSGNIDTNLFSDGLHPNAEGYIRIANFLRKYIK